MTTVGYAQPKARRAQQQKTEQKSNANNMTERARLMFPTMAPLSENVVWRRDVYRELDLTKDANAGLYYPVEPVGTQMNLFTCIFKLMMTGQVRAYEYRLDGNEVFEDSSRIKPMDFLNNYHIYFERVNGRVRIDNSDIPSREVKSYYIKECSYYDQTTATFHTKVLALCPIMTRDDDFGDSSAKYPLFWVKYDDLAPYLAKQQIMTSNLNNAATMSVDDYFTMNQYDGKIYKTNNMLGKILSQYCPNDSSMTQEQKRIEKQISDFEKNIWGNQAKKDSLDSIAKMESAAPRKSKKTSKRRQSSSENTETVSEKKVKTRRASSSSSARVTVRRQRH
jgi:gliding motility associated protien GldN